MYYSERAREYALALKKSKNYTNERISQLSNISIDSVKNFMSGKCLKNPGYETVVRIIVALDGDPNEAILGIKKTEESIDAKSIEEYYENKIKNLIECYEERIGLILSLCDDRVADIQKNCGLRISDLKLLYKEWIADVKEIK